MSVEAVHVRSTWLEEMAAADTLVGGVGGVVSATGGEATVKVTEALPEMLPAVSVHFT